VDVGPLRSGHYEATSLTIAVTVVALLLTIVAVHAVANLLISWWFQTRVLNIALASLCNRAGLGVVLIGLLLLS
jgi:hypothetical protein